MRSTKHFHILEARYRREWNDSGGDEMKTIGAEAWATALSTEPVAGGKADG